MPRKQGGGLMQDCRNCGSRKLKELGFIGEVAPFFLKRVLNMEIGTSQARHPLRLLARRLCAFPQRLFARVYGCFLPRLKGRKYVFEISDISPLEGIVRIPNEADLATYSYVQIAHVLEHVPEPLALLKRVSSFVKPSGYLYIEVPQELTDAEIAELQNGP